MTPVTKNNIDGLKIRNITTRGDKVLIEIWGQSLPVLFEFEEGEKEELCAWIRERINK